MRKENIKKKTFPIYNQRLAGFLMLNGYVLMGMEENHKHKGKHVFFFIETTNIKQSIQTYFGGSEKKPE